MSQLTRPDLDLLPTYVPGRSVPGAIKLASNEVPYGPLPGVVEAITQAAMRHPPLPGHGRGGAARQARRALRRRPGAGRHRLRLGRDGRAPGPRDLPARRRDAVYSWRSFEAYPIIAATTGRDQRAGAEHRRARPRPDGDGRGDHRPHPDGPGLQPEQPDRYVVAPAELDAFLDAVPSDVLVVLDEAYREFVTDPDVPDGIEAYARPAERGRAAYAVEGVGPGRPAGRLHRGSARRRGRDSQGASRRSPRPASRRRPRWPRWPPKTRCAAAPIGDRRARPGARRHAPVAPGRAGQPGELRLAAAGRRLGRRSRRRARRRA